MMAQDEETLELRDTFTSLQQEVEAKTKKLKKVGSLLKGHKINLLDIYVCVCVRVFVPNYNITFYPCDL